MARILAVGIVTLDVIQVVEHYPVEDSETRCLEQRLSRGGNATNTLVVLSQLGHVCAWAGVSVSRPGYELVWADLQRYQIESVGRRVETEGSLPTSHIILNRQNGSRTILHYRDLPEFTAADLQKIGLDNYDWLHFEGRAVPELLKMVGWARQICPNLPISLEVEKPRLGIAQVFPEVDIVLCSRHFAQSQGYEKGPDFLRAMWTQVPEVDWICAWGAEGGYGMSKEGMAVASPAYSPLSVVDTLGAGDTFNAGIIDGYVRGQSLEQALSRACQLAGRKCGQWGLAGLQTHFP